MTRLYDLCDAIKLLKNFARLAESCGLQADGATAMNAILSRWRAGESIFEEGGDIFLPWPEWVHRLQEDQARARSR